MIPADDLIAFTHVPSPRMQQCELTFVPAAPIDDARALAQHAEYCQALQDCGATVRVLDVNREFPDCTFLEDAAVVLDEVAILCPMGTASRRDEPNGIEPELHRFRNIARIELPAMIEGGDLLRVGRRLLVGLSSRTNAAGIRALEEIVSPFGYEILPIPVHGCLHLKTACTALPDHSLLINPDWLDVAALQGFQCRSILPSEPWAANVALVNGHVIAAANQQASIDQLIDLGFQVHPVDISEFQKAEGGVTCLSLLLSQHRSL